MDISSLDRYQLEALRTQGKYHSIYEKLSVLGLGIAGESGEVADLIKKVIGHGHPLDTEKVIIELGDVMWYVATLADAAGASLSEVASRNIAKLKARYPEGFSYERSIGRDEQVELGL